MLMRIFGSSRSGLIGFALGPAAIGYNQSVLIFGQHTGQLVVVCRKIDGPWDMALFVGISAVGIEQGDLIRRDGALQIVDIRTRDVPPNELALVVAKWIVANQKPSIGAVVLSEAKLQLVSGRGRHRTIEPLKETSDPRTLGTRGRPS